MIEFHDLPGKFAHWNPEKWPGATRPQSNPDQMDIGGFVNQDRFRAFTCDPAPAKNRAFVRTIQRAKCLRITEIDDQLHCAIGQNQVSPWLRQRTTRHPEMLHMR